MHDDSDSLTEHWESLSNGSLKKPVDKFHNNFNLDSPYENPDEIHIEGTQAETTFVPTSVNSTSTRRGRRPLHQAVQEEHLFVVEKLLCAGADVNAVDENGLSPLHFAAQSGNASITSTLLAKGANVFAQEYELSEQPIHMAASTGRLEVVNLLLDNGASADALTALGDTPLIYGVGGGYIRVVERLLENASLVGASNWKSGRQPIHQAAAGGHLRILDLLVSKNADIEAEDFDGSTPLILASKYGCLSSVSYLLQKGAKVDSVWGNDRWSALLSAAAWGYERIVRLLHAYSANIDSKSTVGFTPLHLAASRGCLGMLKFLLHEGAQVNATCDTDGYSAVLIAIAKGHQACADLLISHGADIHIIGKDNTTTLWHACSRSMPNLAQRLLDGGVPPNLEHVDIGHTALHQAAALGDVSIVNSLLAHSADINIQAKGDMTPLWLAAKNGHKEVVEALLKAKADPNIACQHSSHAIHLAAQSSHLEVIRLLLPHITDVDVRDDDGISPLWIAAHEGSTEIVSLLIKNGADVNATRISNGRLPIHQAASRGHLEIVAEIAKANSNVDRKAKVGVTALWLAVSHDHQELAKFLLQHTVDVNATSKGSGASILHHACSLSDWTIFDLLLEHNPKLDQPDHDGTTPLMVAAAKGHLHHVTSLISRGVNVSARDTDYRLQAIHRAALGGHLDIVKLLLEHGASVDAMDSLKVTPLWLAAREGHIEVVEYLLERGACATAAKQDDRCQAIHEAAEKGHSDIVEVLLNNGAEPDAQTVLGFTPLWLASQCGSDEIVTLLIQRNANVHVVVPKPKIVNDEEGLEVIDEEEEEDE